MVENEMAKKKHKKTDVKKRRQPAPNTPANISGLSWIPINDFFLVPPYLVEQIEGRDYAVADLYQMAPQFMAGNNCILGVFVDHEHKIQGFMWAGVNPLSKRLIVHALSVDPAYQRRGIVAEAKAIIDKITADLKLNGFYFYTQNPQKFRSAGMTESGMVQMEG
jgi:hypothetical protein